MKLNRIVFIAAFVMAAMALLGFSLAIAADSGGYGSSQSSGGYGSAPAKADSGGYGSAPAKKTDSGGYGSSQPSSGYGSAPAKKQESSGYGSAPAAKPAAKKTEIKTKTPAATPAAPSAPAATATTPAAPSAPAATTAPAMEAAPQMEQTKAPEPVAAPSAPQMPEREFPAADIMFVVSALAVGMMLGWVLQRGRFCMNSAFRDTIFIQDFTFFHAYILALMVAIVGVNLLNDIGAIKVSAQPFWPFAHIIGGYIFGLGIVLAGGCGSGIWYRVGEGLLAAWVAVFGFFIGIAATMSGIFKPLYKLSREVTLLADKPTVWQLFGQSTTIKWIVIAVLVIAGAFWIRKSDPFKLKAAKGYYWSVTGVLIGGIAVLAFWASYVFGGDFARGLSFTTPTIEFFNTILRHDARPSIFPIREIGFVKTTWGVFFIVGVPLGAFLSARGLKEFSWKVPPASELLTVFGGSLMMGFGATLALGCNMGQGITGVSTLSVGSIMATIAIILGNWTMVYFKFIKPMQDE